MADKDTVSIIAEEIGSAFAPLKDMVATPAAFKSALKDLGWDWDAPQVIPSVKHLGDLADFGNIDQVLVQIPILLTAIDALTSDNSSFPGFTAPVAAEFKNDFPGEIVQYLLVEYFLHHRPKVGSLLQLLSIIAINPVSATGTRPAYSRRVIDFKKVGDIFGNSLKLLQDHYVWNSPNLSKDLIYANIGAVWTAFNFDTKLQDVKANFLQVLNPGLAAGTFDKQEVTLILVKEQIANASIGAGINFYVLPQNGSLLPGLAIMPYSSAQITGNTNLNPSLTFQYKTTLDLEKGVAVVLRPGQAPQLISNLAGGGTAGGQDAKVTLGLEYQKPGGAPTIVFGATNASHYEFQSISVTAAANITTQGSKDVKIEFDLKGSKIIIKPAAGDSDGFLSKILPGEGITLAFELGFGFGLESGFYFKGSSGLEIDIPAHLELGPIEIETVKIGIKPFGGDIPINICVRNHYTSFFFSV